MRGRDLEKPADEAGERLLGLDPAHRRGELAREQLDHVVAGARTAAPSTFGTQRPTGGRIDARRLDVRRGTRRRRRAARTSGTGRRCPATAPRACRARSSAAIASAVPTIAYWRPGALWLTTSTSSPASASMSSAGGSTTASRYGEAPSASRGTCACIASPRAVDERQRGLERRARRARAAPRTPPRCARRPRTASPSAPSAAQLGELRGGERDQRRLRELGAEQDAVGMPGDAARPRAAARAGCARRLRAARTRALRACARRRAPTPRARHASARGRPPRALRAGSPGRGR